jgi:phenylacetate-CoA ligase
MSIRKQDIDKLNHAEIREYQEKELENLLSFLSESSPFYKKRFRDHNINSGNIKHIEDLKHIPPTTKEDLQKYGNDFMCVGNDMIVDLITTSGTLGEPVTFAMTENDLQRLAYNEFTGFKVAGCTNRDIFQLMTTIDRRFMAGLAYFMGTRMLRAAIIRVGNGIPEMQWDSIKRFSPNVIVAVPSFILNIIDFAEKNGIDHTKCSIRKAICIGEPIRNTDFTHNTLGRKIHERWQGLQLYSTYASTEMATSFTECEFGAGGHHHPDLIITEFLDDNDNVLPEGEQGELTITTLGVEGMPLLRFKTGDICRAHYEPCRCGRNTMRLGPVIGRKKQMIKFKGTTLYPPALYDILDNIDGILNYLVEVYTNDLGNDEIVIRVGSHSCSEAFEKVVKDHFRAKLRVAPSVKFETPEYINSIQQVTSGRKTVKLIDRRGNPDQTK